MSLRAKLVMTWLGYLMRWDGNLIVRRCGQTIVHPGARVGHRRTRNLIDEENNYQFEVMEIVFVFFGMYSKIRPSMRNQYGHIAGQGKILGSASTFNQKFKSASQDKVKSYKRKHEAPHKKCLYIHVYEIAHLVRWCASVVCPSMWTLACAQLKFDSHHRTEDTARVITLAPWWILTITPDMKCLVSMAGYVVAHMWPLVTSLRLRARAWDAKCSPLNIPQPILFVWCLRLGHKMTHM